MIRKAMLKKDLACINFKLFSLTVARMAVLD